MLRPSVPPQARRVLELARRDRAAATRALAELSPDGQLALLCETPVALRAELLALAPEPEALIPRLPPAELCFTVKSVGLADAAWILGSATPEQIVAAVDLDAWSGFEPDRKSLDAWLDALAQTDGEALVRAVCALDPELVVLLLKARIEVVQRPSDDPGWEQPAGARTLDGQFFFTARAEGDDLASLARLLDELFQADYWSYFRLLQGVIWELDSDSEEWALRWRTGRLQDLGFPPWEEAATIYRHIPPSELAALPAAAAPLDVSAFPLPVWLPELPAPRDAPHPIFEAVAQLDAEERRGALYAFAALANKVAVADRMPLSDAEATPRAIEKAARVASAGLRHLARARELAPVEVLRRASLERLYRVGANLDPERSSPERP